MPALGALAVEPIYVAVDTAIIGRVGTSELAGLAAAATILALVVAGSNFLAYGTTERVARALGGGQTDTARSVATQSLWVAILLSLVFVFVLITGAPSLIALVGVDGSAASFGVRYLRIAALGLPAVLIAIAAQGVLRGAGDYRRPLIALGLGNVLNVIIELPLVFTFGLSVTGSAVSTVISQWVVAFVFFPMLRPLVGTRGERGPIRREMLQLLMIGRNLVLRVVSMLAVLTGAALLAARGGVSDLASHQIVAGTFMLLALVLDAVSVPAHTLIGQALGAGDDHGARHISVRVFTLSILGGIVLAVMVCALAGPVAGIFSVDPQVRASAAEGLVVLGIILVPGAVAFAGDGVLIGAGDHRFLGIASTMQALVMIPFLFLPEIARGPGVSSIWLLLGVWMVMRALTVTARCRSLFWSSGPHR